MYNQEPVKPFRVVAIVALSLVLLIVILVGSWSGIKAFNRHQRVADANNDVKTSQIRANNQTKLNEIRIAQQAQDEIAKTLTPLYVQFEMVEALKDIAKSGKNNTVVYLPSGDAGIPLVSGVAGQPSVKGGAR